MKLVMEIYSIFFINIRGDCHYIEDHFHKIILNCSKLHESMQMSSEMKDKTQYKYPSTPNFFHTVKAQKTLKPKKKSSINESSP